MSNGNPLQAESNHPIGPGDIFFNHHVGWMDENEIVGTIKSRAQTERGDVIIEVPQLSDFDIVDCQDPDQVEFLLYGAREDLRQAIAKLDPGKYTLTRPPNSHWVLQLDETITDMAPRTPFETEIDPQELSHCRDLKFMPVEEFAFEDMGHGLGVATHRDSTGEKFFMKSTGRKPKEFFIKEVTALYRLSHPNIVVLKACVLNGRQKIIGFLTEFAEGGDLHQYKDSPAWLKKKWVLQVTDALQYIQKEGIEYQDIKRGNIVIIQEQAKLVDFDGGFSRGHFKEGFESFPLAILLEALGVPKVDELVGDAKTTPMPLHVFQARLTSISLA